jgi:hypothetical protein
MKQEVRVTTQAKVFDDHFENHQFLSPGGSLFERIASECLADSQSATTVCDGKIWLLVDEATQNVRFLARRDGQFTACDSVSLVIDAIQDQSAAGPFDPTRLKSTEKPQLLV